MDFVMWAQRVASAHPQLRDAVITVHDEWLDILLADGRSFRFRPGALINPDSDEDKRTDILNRLLSIGIAEAPPPPVDEQRPDTSHLSADVPAVSPHPSLLNTEHGTDVLSTPDTIPADDDGDTPAPLLPLVDSAPYFLNSHHDGDSIVYVPLTDFVAVGLVRENEQGDYPVFYSQLADSMRDVGEVMSEAVMNLRAYGHSSHPSIEVGVAALGQAHMLSILKPEGFQLSWWCDVELMHSIAEHVTADRPGDIPLFIPVAQDQLFIVFADDPHLIDVVRALIFTSNPPTMVYPLPHTLAADGWAEWVPLPGDELSQALSQLRTEYRQYIYQAQADIMNRWGDLGNVKEYRTIKTQSGEFVGSTTWEATDGHGSVPDTEMITFIREESPHPWDTEPAVNVTLRARVAREIWPEGFEQDKDAWPPRWKVTGFPDAETIERLQQAVNRDF
ncbi:hypothetical protein [Arcanobacterium buesumense]|uniref:Uncharacterized protein n=1 Tax=Arcanobacterium buesumense TaxID=2722751 RepID=A0A6H2ENE4_9ACTO|nr:hypothetical protein [Arcanobacterium buesumense]QJC22584.1 hypothetical protein HC352_08785 [Arcanobacterium buesumense]